MIGHPLKVRELLDEIERGEVILPEIQRSYVWKGPQVTRLLDSIYREYPTGQILLWDTTLLPVIKPIEGAVGPPDSMAGRPKIVLDGQQRLTSLHQALGNAKNGIKVYFNLETEQFHLHLKRFGGDPLWVPVRDIVQNRLHDLQVLERIAKAGGLTIGDPKSQEYLNRLQSLKKIGEYKYPIEIFRSDDYEEVTELFVRVNSAGTRLRTAELVLAQLAMRLPGAIVDTFEQAIDEYEDLGYELDARFLIRALIAAGTGQSRFRYLTDFWKKDPQEIKQIWRDTRKGIDAAVNFVRHNARFESSEWLPSLSALIPLVVFFTRHPRLAQDVEVGLLRWFYVASLRGRYSTSAETAMDEDIKALDGENPTDILYRNAVAGRAVEVTAEEFDDAGWRNPLFPMTYAVARKRGAKDWFRGVALTTDVVGEDNEIQVHHIFPKALLRQQGVKRKDIDEIANLAFLAARPNRQISKKPPDAYLAEIADKHPERLEAQSVPMDRRLWKLENYHEFLEGRRKLLADAVNDLLRKPV
ncbi:MAG: DUF262 domain-containing protein [Nitrospiraceae bacterium]|nr:DUF262 domain-containing protein [Nitrospiraceae bacterium]